MSAPHEHPLAGLRILDMSWLLPGPFCTGVLADLGADVVKVEPPGGDYYQAIAPGAYTVINAGKVVRRLDLKSTTGRNELRRIIQEADVFIEGFRPGVMARLGFDFAAVSSLNPRIIYASISGYGQTGPLSDRPGHDVNYMAKAGALSIPDTIGVPSARGGLPIGDLAAGLFTAVNILSAIVANRAGTAIARYIDMSITEAILHLGQIRYADYLADPPDRRSWHHLLGGNGVFTTSDGVRLALGVVETKFWDAFWPICSLPVGTEQILTEPECRKLLEQQIASRGYDFWEDELARLGLPFTKVSDPEEAMADPLFEARGIRREFTGAGGETIQSVALPGRMVPTARRNSNAF